MICNRLLFSIFILNYCILLINAGVGFLKDQRKCLVKCENHGVCAYEIGRPQIHRCICMTNMYYGDLCQYSVTAPPPTQRILVTTTQEIGTPVEPRRPIKIVPPVVADEAESPNKVEEMLEEEVTLENETSMEKSEEQDEFPKSGKASSLTLEEEEEEANKKSIEIEKNDDYFEPTESSNSAEHQPHNIDATSNGYFEPDTQLGQYQKTKTTHSVEPDDVIEEESGWMMVKKKTNSAHKSTLNFHCIAILTAILFVKAYIF